MTKHQNRATPRELDAYNAFLLLELKVAESKVAIAKWHQKLPTKTQDVVQAAYIKIHKGENFVIPADMPECDAQDVLRTLERFQGLYKALQRKQSEAGSLVVG